MRYPTSTLFHSYNSRDYCTEYKLTANASKSSSAASMGTEYKRDHENQTWGILLKEVEKAQTRKSFRRLRNRFKALKKPKGSPPESHKQLSKYGLFHCLESSWCSCATQLFYHKPLQLKPLLQRQSKHWLADINRSPKTSTFRKGLNSWSRNSEHFNLIQAAGFQTQSPA